MILYILWLDDLLEILNILWYWDEVVYFWLDVVDVKMGVFFSLEVIEKLYFNLVNLLVCFEVLLVCFIYYFNCLVYIRKDIYERMWKMCLFWGINYVVDCLVIYIISVEIGR